MLKKLTKKVQLVLGTFALVLTLALCVEGFSMVSNAETQAKVTASSAKVRKEASTSSDTVGSAAKDTVVTVVGETQGSDGYVWYQVVVDGNISGYIRSDLVALTETEISVEKLNPVSGTVSGSSSVRVRQSATTSSSIVKNVTSGTALTVTGRTTASDGWVWYQVSFIADGAEVNGFIRSDYVTVSGELTPYTEAPVTPPTEDPGTTVTPDPGTTETPDPVEPEPVKKYETVLRDDIWYVMDTDTNEGWDIKGLMDTAQNNADAYAASEKKVKSQKVVIILLVFLLIGAVAGIAFLIYKIKDMMDSAYFNEVEAETLRRRNAQAAQGQKKVMHTVGEDKKPGASQGTRPQGARPTGASQGQRPAGTPQGQRPAGAPQRPAGAPQGQRPVGAPQGQRPAGTLQGQRPAGAPQGQRPVGAPQGQRPVGAPQATQEQAAKNPSQGQNWQSKNFMADDDDEFEFEFLSYDNDDEK